MVHLAKTTDLRTASEPPECGPSAIAQDLHSPAPRASEEALKQNGRRGDSAAGLRFAAISQATFKLSADDLPVLRSATMS